jgi:hypothetical protein
VNGVLNRPGKATLLPFMKEQGEEIVEEVDNNAEVLNFEEAVKRARLNAPGPVADGFRYVNLSYILASTNIVERLLWPEDRKKMTPATLEMMMFLKINRSCGISSWCSR